MLNFWHRCYTNSRQTIQTRCKNIRYFRTDTYKDPCCKHWSFPLPYPYNIATSGQHSRWLNTLRPRQNARHFADDIFKCFFLNDSVWIPIEISLKFVPRGPINNIPALVQIMAWRRPGDKPLSEPMMVSLPTHICVTRPQWVKVSII